MARKAPVPAAPAGFESMEAYNAFQNDYRLRAREVFGTLQVGDRVKSRFTDSWGTVTELDIHSGTGTLLGVSIKLDTPFTDPMGEYHTHAAKRLATLDIEAGIVRA